tara:strand:- start:6486 stop:8027 length:1542 start_codon:yes stop_codon:yes gene_type:complete
MKSERLIIVDNDLDHLKKMSRYLTNEGFNVATESNSKKALNRLLKEDFDIVFMKQNMTGYYGMSILQQLQKAGSKTSFIIMADSLDIKQAVDIMQEGAYSILMMPYKMEQLKEMVIKGFKNKRAFLEILQLSDNLVKANSNLQNKKKHLEDEQKLLKSKVEELNLLNKLSSLMSSSLNPEIIIESLAQNLKDTVNFDIFSVMMLDGKEIFLKVHSNSPMEKELLNKINRNIYKSFAKYTGKSQCLNKLPEKTAGEAKKVLSIDQGSELDFDLQVAGKKLGVLKVIRFSGEPFSKDQRSLLSTVSNQLALFLNNALEHKKYLGLASYDCLTNTLNRRTFDDIIEREFNRSIRYKTPLSVIMLDLDHFKKINDSWGHQTGDTVLKEVAGIVHSCLRESDVFARYGGEEFVVILPQTDIEKAGILAERIRMAIENKPIDVQEGQVNVTSSIGISCYPFSSVEDKNDLVKMADNALYQAKKNGRNCVFIHSQDNKYREIKIRNETFQSGKIASHAIA